MRIPSAWVLCAALALAACVPKMDDLATKLPCPPDLNGCTGGDSSTPFPDVAGFTAVVTDGQVSLSWNNPADSAFAGAHLIRSTTGFPTSLGDGTQLYVGTGTTYVDTGLINGTTYYYTVFSAYPHGNYSPGGAYAGIAATPPAANRSRGTWVVKQDMPTARQGLAAATLNGQLYALGGTIDYSSNFSTVEIYDPGTNSWTAGPSMPIALNQFGAGSWGTRIYVTPGNSMFHFDSASNQWFTDASLNSNVNAGFGVAVGVINGIVYVAGGGNCPAGTCQATNYLWAFDTRSSTWGAKRGMNTARENAAAVGLNGLLYILGGQINSNTSNTPPTALVSAEAYNPATDSWTVVPDVPTARYNPMATAIAGIIYIFGSGQAYGDLQVDAYNPVTNAWTTKTFMKSQRYGPAASAVSGTLYVVGGTMTGSALGTNEAFTPLPPCVQLSTGCIYPPDDVGGLTVTPSAGGGGGILTWTPPSGTITGYSVVRSTTGYPTSLTGGTAVPPGPAPSFTDAGLVPSTTYYYTVFASAPGPLTSPGGPAAQVALTPPVAGSTDSWASMARMNSQRQNLAAVSVGGLVYAIGGTNCVTTCTQTSLLEAYNPAVGTWTSPLTLAAMPFPASSFVADVIGGKIYVYAGNTNTGPVLMIYDPVSNSWTSSPVAAANIGIGAGAAVNSTLYSAGGCCVDSKATPSNSLLGYDSVAGAWISNLAPMPTARQNAAAVGLNGLLYVMGGRSATSDLPTVEAYNPNMDTWTILPSMNFSRSNHSAATINGIIYVFGPGGIQTEAYNPVTNTWTVLTTPPPNLNFGDAAAALGGKIYLLGSGSTSDLPNSTQQFTP